MRKQWRSFRNGFRCFIKKNQIISTNLREVLGYIRYSKDPKKLEAYIKDNPRMTMEADAARVISAVTRTPFKVDEESEVIDVCKAIDEMMANSKLEGSISTLDKLLRSGVISLGEAAECAQMTEAEFEKAVAKLS